MASEKVTTTDQMVKRMMSSWDASETEARDLVRQGLSLDFDRMLRFFLGWDAISEEEYTRWHKVARELGQ